MMSGLICLVLLSTFLSEVDLKRVYVTNKEREESFKCPAGPVVTATISGELGNNIWDYVSILALSRLLPGNRQPYIREYHEKFIARYFERPLLPIVEQIPPHCSCCNNTDLTKENEGKILFYYDIERVKRWNKPGNVVLHSPTVVVEPVMHEIKFIKNQLRYKQELIQEANQVLTDVSRKFLNQENLGDLPLTFVGVHVRRSDYLQYLTHEEQADSRFFNFAFNYFRERKDLGKCVFVVISDDQQWVKDNLINNKINTDVFLVGDGKRSNPGKDIAAFSLCNHTIFDYGSFGLWGAVYAGGEVVTTSSYAQAHQFIQYKNFHFFDSVPDKELFSLGAFKKSSVKR